MKERFYHTKIDVGAKRPFVITICDLEENNNIVATGISICSYQDQYNRKLGNTIARGRALKALELRICYGPIKENLQSIIPLTHKGIYHLEHEQEHVG